MCKQMSIINNGRAIKRGVGTIELGIEMHFANEPSGPGRGGRGLHIDKCN